MKRMMILVLLISSTLFAGRKLTTNEATKITVGPFVDATDGITPETGLDVTTLTVELYLEKDDGTGATRTTFVPTASGGSNDMTLITSSVSACFDLELTAAQLNATGTMRITIVDTDSASITAAPWFGWVTLTSANAVDAEYGTDALQVDSVELSSDATAAANAEYFFDGTGVAQDVDLSARTLTITADSGSAVTITGAGAGSALLVTGGATGNGIYARGGASSGYGIQAEAQAGDQHGIYASGYGAGEGIYALGGANGDGINAVGQGTGVDIRGDITGNLAGTVTTVTTLTGHTAQTGDTYALANHGTYGFSAIETLVDDLETRLTATRAGYIDTINDWADGGRLDLILDAAKADGDLYDTDAEIAAAVWNALRASYATASTFGETMGTVESNIDNLDQAISTTEDNIRGADSDTLKTISDEIAALNDPTAAEVVTALMEKAITGSYDFDDMFRALVAVTLGESEMVDSDTYKFYDLDGTTLRCTIDYGDDYQRTTITVVTD